MADKREYYIDKFTGGMATTLSNDNIGPNKENPLQEFPIIDNFDFSSRGAFVKRPGTSNMLLSNQDLLDLGLIQSEIDDNGFDVSIYSGTFDAYFRFEAKGFYETVDGEYENAEPEDTAYDIRLGMLDGNLVTLNFIDSLEDTTAKYTVFPTKVILAGLNSGVNMETVQFGNELYITTGDGIYIIRLIRRYIDGVDYSDYELEARRLDSAEEIYYPDGNEYQVIGKNVFFPDDLPDIEDELNSSEPLEVLGIRVTPTTGIINQTFSFSAYVRTSLSGVGSTDFDGLDYSVTYEDGTVIATNDADVGSLKDIEIFPTKAGTYTIWVEFREPSLETAEYQIEYEVVLSDRNVPDLLINTEINECTRILLYYNRIIVYKNGTGKWYKSDINRPAYFTTFSIFDFAAINPESTVEELQSVTPYRNSLLALSKKSMFLIVGKGDDTLDIAGNFEPFQAYRISDKGTIAPYSIAKNENNLIFLSNDGIYVIDSIYVDEKKANLYKISDLIENLVIKDEVNASAVVFNNVYYINFPSGNYTLKWDYIYGQKMEGRLIPERLWSRDISTELIFKNIKVIDDDMYSLVEADVSNSKLLIQNRIEHITDETEIANLEDNLYPDGYFTDDSTVFQALIETKAYRFEDGSRLKKVKQIILELAFGNYTLLYSANENKIIDAQQVPTIIFDIVEGRVVEYSGLLETNIAIEGNFILGSEETGILGVNLLGGINEQYIYYTLRLSKFTQNHKIVISHEEDAYAKILGFGFTYIYGKKPRNRNNSY